MEDKLEQATLIIGGMTCAACVSTIEKALRSISGVKEVNVSLMTECATIVFEKHPTIKDQLCEAVEDCGFEVKSLSVNENRKESLDKIDLRIFGMTCTSCSNTVEEVVSSLEGVASIAVSLSTEEAAIVYDSEKVGIRDIISAIEDCGFDAVPSSSFDHHSQIELLSKVREVQYWKRNFLKCLFFGLPVMVLEHLTPLSKLITGHPLTHVTLLPGLYLEQFVQFILASYIQFGLGKPFYIHSYKAMSHGSGSMDLLICVSTSIAYIYSVVTMIMAIFAEDKHMYMVLFDTSAMLFIFVSLGKWMENEAKGQASTALSKLLSLTPSTCEIVEGGNIGTTEMVVKQISIDVLQKGDIVVLYAGTRIPTDGICIFGESDVDESLLTGEARTVHKPVGSELIGGSVNVSNTVYMKVTVVGSATKLQQIVRWVQDAQKTKAPIQSIADAVGSRFVPTIMILAISTFSFWSLLLLKADPSHIPDFFVAPSSGKLMYVKVVQLAISVVVVACPCALGLAAPTAIMVGTGVGATSGILIKGGDVLESASRIDYVVFDKTGTLTTGVMEVGDFKFLKHDLFTEEQIWEILGTLEGYSDHPTAKAIERKARSMIDETHCEGATIVHSADTVPGYGVVSSLTYQGHLLNIKVGRSKLFGAALSNPEELERLFSNTAQREITLSHFSINDRYMGYIELSDDVKDDAAATVKYLKSQGYKIAMVTGDDHAAALRVAKQVSINEEDVYAATDPEGKCKFVARLQDSNYRVAFIGDGINDAPALVKSNLGIAISSGTDIAIEAADIVLLNNFGERASSQVEVSGVASALSISTKTFRRIKQNFFWAIVYNLVMVPIAMGFFVPLGLVIHPMIASGAMAMSSVSVVLSSLMLKKWKPVELKGGSGVDEAFDLESQGFAVGKERGLLTAWVQRVKKVFSRDNEAISSPAYELLPRN